MEQGVIMTCFLYVFHEYLCEKMDQWTFFVKHLFTYIPSENILIMIEQLLNQNNIDVDVKVNIINLLDICFEQNYLNLHLN